MRKVLLMISFMLFSTPAFAEKWICYDTGSTPANQISVRVQGDCLVLGICTGNNNTGILPNCFEATNAEYNKADDQYVKVDPPASVGNRVIDWTAQEISDYIATQNQAADTSMRESAKSEYDGLSSQALVLKALVITLIEEVNILRQAVEDMSVESNQITDKNLPPRTLAQAKTAIKNKIDSGDVDAE